jgi:hypothetical protein
MASENAGQASAPQNGATNRLPPVLLDCRGGPGDGWVSLERMPRPGQRMTFSEMVALTAIVQTRGGQVGERFDLISLGLIARMLVSRTGWHSYVYEIVEQHEVEGELLLVADYVGYAERQ